MPTSDELTELDPRPENAKRVGVSARVRVCLITTEFHGLFKNGGIGTANTGLALALAHADFDVTVAYANSDENGPRLSEGDFPGLRATYRQLGITLDFVPASHLISRPFDDVRSASYCVYLYLKQHEFDVVYFNDCGGHGYYSLLAKRVGVFQNPPRMYVVSHGPQEWVMEINSIPYRDRWPVITAFMERRSAALADAVISPSRYLVEWMTGEGWDLPAEVLVVPNIVTLPRSVAPAVHGAKSEPITEIVFFGRLEVRKGLELFCDAIDLLNQDSLRNVRITFLGKFAHVAGLHSGIYVVERARTWRSSLRILSTYAQEEALAYLRRAGVLAVIPSLAENSPCVVAECLELGLPFIATDSGGTAELVAAGDRDLCLIAPDPRKLAARLELIFEYGHRSGSPAFSLAHTSAKWLSITESGVTEAPGEGAVGERPLVSVCLAPASFTSAVETLLDSLVQQNYPRLEIILVDVPGFERSGFARAASGADREHIPLRVLPGISGDRGAARNAAAADANGEYLLFVEEEMVILAPGCVDALLSAALRTNAGIVTGVPLLVWSTGRAAARVDGSLGYFPIGACAELGAVENCFGKGVLLVDRLAFERRGGFETSCDPAIEDWLFLAGSVLAGLRLEVVPEPLFRYRMVGPSELNRASVVDNFRRILGAYSGQQMRIFRHMIEAIADINQANHERLQQVIAEFGSGAREIALRVSTAVEPNHPDALRGMVQFCVERHRIDEAFDFAFHNGRPLLSDALASATLVAEDLALDSVRRHRLDLWHDVSLIDEVRLRVPPVISATGQEFAQSPSGVTQPIQDGVTILTAAGVCPPATRFVRAFASVDAPQPQSVLLAMVVATPQARLRLAQQDLASDEAFWWSGWVSTGRQDATLELFVAISEPVEQLLDIHFLSKTHEDGADEGEVTWTNVTASVSVNAISRSVIELSELTTPIPLHVLNDGILLTENREFSFPIFVPGNPTLVHPLPGKVVLVRFEDAVPPGAKGVRSVVSLERVEAHPVQFAVWIKSAAAVAWNVGDFTESDAFSGWFTVRDKFRRHRFTVTLADRAPEAMDLYLATRVVEYPDVYYCHSVWHELLILE